MLAPRGHLTYTLEPGKARLRIRDIGALFEPHKRLWEAQQLELACGAGVFVSVDGDTSLHITHAQGGFLFRQKGMTIPNLEEFRMFVKNMGELGGKFR